MSAVVIYKPTIDIEGIARRLYGTMGLEPVSTYSMLEKMYGYSSISIRNLNRLCRVVLCFDNPRSALICLHEIITNDEIVYFLRSKEVGEIVEHILKEFILNDRKPLSLGVLKGIPLKVDTMAEIIDRSTIERTSDHELSLLFHGPLVAMAS